LENSAQFFIITESYKKPGRRKGKMFQKEYEDSETICKERNLLLR
jgi:hypothetical protein